MAESEASLHTLETAEDSLESLSRHQGRQYPVIHWLLLVFGLAVVCAPPLLSVDVSVSAQGLARPTVELINLQTSSEGYIKTLLVKDNQQVKAGEVLMVTSSPSLEEKIARNREQQEVSEVRSTDLNKVIARITTLQEALADGGQSPDLGTGSEAMPNLHSASYREQFSYFLSQFESRFSTETKTRQNWRRMRHLHEKRLVTDDEFERSSYDLANAVAGRKQLIKQYSSRWTDENLSEELRRADLAADARQLALQKDQQAIRAPVDGTVIGFTGLNPQMFLPAGHVLGQISPDGPIQIEAYVLPKDIGFIRLHQRAAIQTDAFPYTQWGVLVGEVSQISDDLVTIGQRSLFRVRVSVDDPILTTPAGQTVRVSKGMTGNVRFVVGSRTVLQLLYQSVSQWVDPSAKTY